MPMNITPFMSQKKTGPIFRSNFVAGGQIVPKKCLCDRIEKDGWDGCQGQKFVRGSVCVCVISSGYGGSVLITQYQSLDLSAR